MHFLNKELPELGNRFEINAQGKEGMERKGQRVWTGVQGTY